jgi:hypothetical protein
MKLSSVSPLGTHRGGVRGFFAWGLAVPLLLLAGCSTRTAPPPEAGYERGGVPDLRGERVLVLPPQLVRGGHPDLERELVYALETLGPSVDWVGPEAIRRRAASTPSLGFDPSRLPVERFQAGELERLGDPLFGALYRLGAIEDASFALLTVETRERIDDEDGGDTVVEVAAALVHIRSGRVYWFGIVEGIPGAAGALPPTVSAVESLARRLLR